MATSDATPVGSQPGATTGKQSALAGRLALVVVCLGVFLSALDQTVVVTALLKIIPDIGVPITRPDRAAWCIRRGARTRVREGSWDVETARSRRSSDNVGLRRGRTADTSTSGGGIKWQ